MNKPDAIFVLASLGYNVFNSALFKTLEDQGIETEILSNHLVYTVQYSIDTTNILFEVDTNLRFVLDENLYKLLKDDFYYLTSIIRNIISDVYIRNRSIVSISFDSSQSVVLQYRR